MSVLDVILESVPAMRPTADEVLSRGGREGLAVPTLTTHRLVNFRTQRYLTTEALLLLIGREDLDSPASLHLRRLSPAAAATLIGRSEHVGLLRRRLAKQLERAGITDRRRPIRVVLHCAGIASELEVAPSPLLPPTYIAGKCYTAPRDISLGGDTISALLP